MDDSFIDGCMDARDRVGKQHRKAKMKFWRDMKIWARLTVVIGLALLGSWLAMASWQSAKNKEAAIRQAESFAGSMHEATMAGLTGMMITGTVGQSEVFLDQIKQLSSIKDLKVVRADGVVKQFGAGKANPAQSIDAEEQEVLKTKKPLVKVESEKGEDYLRVVRPVLASPNYLGKNCMGCHMVPEGTALGLVSMKVSLSEVNASMRDQRNKSIWAALGACVALTLGLFFFIRSAVAKPLEGMVESFKQIAKGDGDLGKRLPVLGQDEVGEASMHFNTMMDKISGLIRRVSDASHEVEASAKGLASEAGSMVEATSSQTRSVEHAASKVESMAHAARGFESEADEAGGLSARSVASQAEGAKDMESLSREVGELDKTIRGIAESVADFLKSTESIGALTKQVRGIAAQTNLLALNAAIEAARAGESGRGFAVVADEVKKLAEKSDRSASEIDAVAKDISARSSTIGDSLGGGLARIAKSQESMAVLGEALVAGRQLVEQVGARMRQIKDQASEQSGQGSHAAASLDEVLELAKANENSVDRAAKAAEKLNDLAGKLLAEVGKFKT